MRDCSKDVEAFHNEVRLPLAEQIAMRKRRNSNRDRLKVGLDEEGDPKPRECCSQGSYAMKTMLSSPDHRYDIDDGVYFDKGDLVGAHGAYKSALDARKMVRDAIDDGSFKTPPEVRSNCVRVHYQAGYHVDIPVYRRVAEKDIWGNQVEYCELASVDWKRSDARAVTAWYENENDRQSPDDRNGRQLRRMTRLGKQFAKSRSSWSGRIASGFMITKLVTECYRANAEREDEALYYTLKGIRDRLQLCLVVEHPVTPNETISKGGDDATAAFLRDKLTEALETLSVLFDPKCTRSTALAAWDQVFHTDFFSQRIEKKDAEESAQAAAIVNAGMLRGSSAPRAVNKGGSGTYA